MSQKKSYQLVSLTLIFVVLSITGCSVKQPGQVAIASAHPLATQAGFEVLNKGGNVYDAAVAVSAALAVVEPSGSGLGGGGFWLLHRESDGLDIMLDGREKAPLAANKDMFLDTQGNAVKSLSLNGPSKMRMGLVIPSCRNVNASSIKPTAKSLTWGERA